MLIKIVLLFNGAICNGIIMTITLFGGLFVMVYCHHYILVKMQIHEILGTIQCHFLILKY